MPTSDHRHLSPTAREIVLANPKTVLDIGIGLGKWGMLAREYTDAWCHRRYKQKDWQTKIVGVEVFPEYRNPVWDLYDGLYIGDVLEVLPDVWEEHQGFDLCIMMDVLEHIPHDRGLGLVKDIGAHCSNFILSFANTDQRDIGDNSYEDHISRWKIRDFSHDFDVKVLDATPGEVQALMLLKLKGRKA